MARPSVKAERTEEILNAFERCVARLGIEGTTLERIAEESGLRRSLLRYHVGNRDILVQALADRYIESSRLESQRLVGAMPEQQKTETLLNYLFDNVSEERARLILVAGALVSAADLYPTIKEPMLKWYQGFVATLSDIIANDYPEANEAELQAVSWGIASLLLTAQSITPLEPGEEFHQASRLAAERLLASLESAQLSTHVVPPVTEPEPVEELV
ncbi:MAG: hypothetical protein OIF35_12950 [Cellvibrionaceae bacterium]|nr:hypothetical protein [Cellvibrionaceae bacterium]MCV6627370.1 hypothetical protein [Cellvibrionaceae bacterium]